MKFGARNSLITTVMPTAGTAQIMGCSECVEPYISNIYTRTTLTGEFVIINQNLIKTLIENNLWNNEMKKLLIINNGSIQNIKSIPQYIKDVYKTAFEIRNKSIIQQAIDRGKFIDQSQSLNLFLDTPDMNKLYNAHHFGWKNGLKTGMYYLRSLPAIDPIKFGVDINDIKRLTNGLDTTVMSNTLVFENNKCSLSEECSMCS
jgi:ribonucleotide reductase alpha subunit